MSFRSRSIRLSLGRHQLIVGTLKNQGCAQILPTDRKLEQVYSLYIESYYEYITWHIHQATEVVSEAAEEVPHQEGQKGLHV